MEISVERVDDTKVKLEVTVEADRVEQAINEAAKRLANEVKIPGFRPGRVPRRVLESRIGSDALVQEAAREALPQFYQEAVQSEDLHVAGQPELDVDTFQSGEEAKFSATVEVVPDIEPPAVDDIEVDHPDWEVTEQEVQQQLLTLRERFASLETADRPAEAGDAVLVTIVGERDGERVDEASGEDLLYEISDPNESDSEVDRNLIGAEAGETITFTDTLGEDFGEELAGAEVDFTVTVHEVKERSLPELTDDFVDENTEFDTAEQLEAELRRQMAEHKRSEAAAELRNTVVEQVSDRVEVTVPDTMAQEELRYRLERLQSDAQRSGMSLDQYLQSAGGEDIFTQLDQQARATVKAQIVLDAIGHEAGIEVTRDDLESEIFRQAERLGQDPSEIAEYMSAEPERLQALASDTFRRKAIDHLLERVTVRGGPPAEEDDQGEGALRAAAQAAALAESEPESEPEPESEDSEAPDAEAPEAEADEAEADDPESRDRSAGAEG